MKQRRDDGRLSTQQSTRIPPSLLAGERPIGRGARFHPAVSGPVLGRCTRTLGRRSQAHIEIFGANRVVLLGIGIGTRPPRRQLGGRLTVAACFGNLVTLDPTGTVYFRPCSHVTLGDVFRSWGQSLSGSRVASFHHGQTTVFIDGVRRRGSPSTVPLRNGAEIVVENGPHVPPHVRFGFPPLPSPWMR